MLYFRYMVQAERVTNQATFLSFVWLIIAYASFAVGAFVARRSRGGAQRVAELPLQRTTTVVVAAFLFTCAVAFLWIGVAIIELGGLARMAALAVSNNMVARDVLLSAAFPGGRLISTGFIGLSVFCAAYLTQKRPVQLEIVQAIPFVIVFVISMTYLFFIPIIMSGRVNFFTAVIASYAAVCLSQGKFVGIRYMPIPIALLIAVWSMADYYALRHVIQISAVDQAYQGILFYFYNDVSNAMNVIGKIDGHYGYGWNSLRFVFFLTFTDGAFLSLFRDNVYYLAQFRPGGEFPLLTAPYADFGIFGILFLIILGYITSHYFYKSFSDPIYSTIYGMLFAGLLLSVHASYITNQETVYNIILISVLIWASKMPMGRAYTRASSFRGV